MKVVSYLDLFFVVVFCYVVARLQNPSWEDSWGRVGQKVKAVYASSNILIEDRSNLLLLLWFFPRKIRVLAGIFSTFIVLFQCIYCKFLAFSF